MRSPGSSPPPPPPPPLPPAAARDRDEDDGVDFDDGDDANLPVRLPFGFDSAGDADCRIDDDVDDDDAGACLDAVSPHSLQVSLACVNDDFLSEHEGRPECCFASR